MATERLLLLLMNTAAIAAVGSSPYYLFVSSNGPITTGARGSVEASLVPGAGMEAAFLPPTDYLSFHWEVQRPLSVVSRWRRGALISSLIVRSHVPGLYILRAWVRRVDCLRCLPLAHTATTLHVTDSVIGTLSLTQLNRSVTSTNIGYELATNTPTKISFILYDPSRYFSSSFFRFRWHFGDGERRITNDSYAFHIYPRAGIYQAQVEVYVYLSHSQWKSGTFGATLNLLDPINAIEVRNADGEHPKDIMDFHLHVNGSPPLTICWSVSANCIRAVGHACHTVLLERSRDCHVRYPMSEAEPYTLNVRAENGVSSLQTCYKITPWRKGIHPVWFIIPGVTLLTIVLLIILSTTMRSSRSQKDLVEVADFDFSPSGVKSSGWGRGEIFPLCCGPSQSQARQSHSRTTREGRSLLHCSGPPPLDYRTWKHLHPADPGSNPATCSVAQR
ncbi:transmembrane protein 130 [Amblyraja radiata]|uniref:transmembrane protein 130 n=1 Tax=Amblyraja radiata TaxID=386614 RepID=UPI001403757A|nr:transmembrane protein 130 [Amblyraja radiata]